MLSKLGNDRKQLPPDQHYDNLLVNDLVPVTLELKLGDVLKTFSCGIDQPHVVSKT